MRKTCVTCSKEFFKKSREGKRFNIRKFCSSECCKIYQKIHPNKGTFQIGNHPKTEFKKGNPKPKNAYTFPFGKNHPNWKGKKAKYGAFHERVKSKFGSPKRCTVCGTTDKNKLYEWANLSGEYNNISDYKRMCHSCHKKYDWARKINHLL